MRLLKAAAALVAAVVVFTLVTLPPRPRVASGVDAELRRRTVRGAFHIHTTRSDGTADKAAVARAAARAGLQFAIFAEHGDGTVPPDPPAYIEGVLCIDGVEISTNGGHYIAVGMKAAPYPLGGEASAVVEDVARLGGFGVVAHAASPRRDLAWSDWTLPFQGVEWLNGDNEWRDESRMRLAHGMLTYFVRPAESLARLLDRPVDTIRRLDSTLSPRKVAELAGHDAHGGVARDDRGLRPALPVPSYETMFRTFSINAVLEHPPVGDASADAAAVAAAIRRGRLFTAIDALAAPAVLDFSATAPSARADSLLSRAQQGDYVSPDGPARFRVRASAPPGATTYLLHDGRAIAEAAGGSLDFVAYLPGSYRVEIQVPDAPGAPPIPWVFSNPIYRWIPPPPRLPDVTPTDVFTLNGWRIEKDPLSSAALSGTEDTPMLEYRLSPGERISQFVALAADLPPSVPHFSGIRLTASASAPTRVSVQLRSGPRGEARTGKSVYLDESPRTIDVPVGALRAITGTGSAGPPSSVLLVIDLTNARPGASGTVHFSNLRLTAH
jgi:hypothetical protein